MFPDDVTGCMELAMDLFFCFLYGSIENFRNIFNDGNHKSMPNLERYKNTFQEILRHFKICEWISIGQAMSSIYISGVLSHSANERNDAKLAETDVQNL